MSHAQIATQPRFFSSRRLAHANMFVGDYLKSYDFYRHVFGFSEAYRQPDNLASFLSNGNTYHDFALVDIHSRYARKDQKPGLNHLAFEVNSEEALVNSYKAAVDAGVKFLAAANHDVAYSIYLHDPDGNEVEFYADVVDDWEEARKGIIIKKKPEWVPGVTNVPNPKELFNPNPRLKRLSDTLVQGKRVTHIAIVARNFDAMYKFYTEVAGLSPFFGDRSGPCVLLAGSASSGDIALFRAEGFEPGMHHVGIEVWAESDLDAALAGAEKVGGRIIKDVNHASRRGVSFADCDGLVMQLYINRDWQPATIATVNSADLPYLL